METRRLDVGLDSITRSRVGDENGLPNVGPGAPAFLTRQSAMDDILRPLSFEERVPALLRRLFELGHDFLNPIIFSEVAQTTQKMLEDNAALSGERGGGELGRALTVVAELGYFRYLMEEYLAAVKRG